MTFNLSLWSVRNPAVTLFAIIVVFSVLQYQLLRARGEK